MGIISPQPSIVLPEDIQKQTETARNNITLLEAEVFRLTKLRGQLESEIIKLGGQQKEIDHGISISSIRADAQSSDIQSNTEILNNLKSEITLIKEEKTQILKEINTQKVEIESAEKQLEIDKKALIEHKNTLANATNLIEKDRNELALKKAILTDCISKL